MKKILFSMCAIFLATQNSYSARSAAEDGNYNKVKEALKATASLEQIENLSALLEALTPQQKMALQAFLNSGGKTLEYNQKEVGKISENLKEALKNFKEELGSKEYSSEKSKPAKSENQEAPRKTAPTLKELVGEVAAETDLEAKKSLIQKILNALNTSNNPLAESVVKQLNEIKGVNIRKSQHEERPFYHLPSDKEGAASKEYMIQNAPKKSVVQKSQGEEEKLPVRKELSLESSNEYTLKGKFEKAIKNIQKELEAKNPKQNEVNNILSGFADEVNKSRDPNKTAYVKELRDLKTDGKMSVALKHEKKNGKDFYYVGDKEEAQKRLDAFYNQENRANVQRSKAKKDGANIFANIVSSDTQSTEESATSGRIAPSAESF